MVQYKKAVVKASCSLCFSTPVKSFLTDETPRGINATWTWKNIFFRLTKVRIFERVRLWNAETSLREKCVFFCFSTDLPEHKSLKATGIYVHFHYHVCPSESRELAVLGLQLISFWNWVLMESFQTMLRQNFLLKAISLSLCRELWLVCSSTYLTTA